MDEDVDTVELSYLINLTPLFGDPARELGMSAVALTYTHE